MFITTTLQLFCILNQIHYIISEKNGNQISGSSDIYTYNVCMYVGRHTKSTFRVNFCISHSLHKKQIIVLDLSTYRCLYLEVDCMM